ncbi:LysR family transcriptional regulator [Paucilactobacillus suebicus DSM 5007 = KCTC 3549]|uniref:LysR family transcriptional regulator n=2 Tax=Paucilactobacillus suebicus TaxID=152335 RepID=A0A0R1WEB9_9LACO|nr:LysR family transcriptional regulator [Paucilactobacillus suebicus DSM 5007 = KCTC 3549]
MLGDDDMIDEYLLQELVAFQQTGTLAATAHQLNVTQPTITRGMQKLENDLGVKLFKRYPNRIELTQTGQLAAIEANKLLNDSQLFVKKIRNFDLRQRNYRIGSSIPGPLLAMQNQEFSEPVSLETQLQQTDHISELLNNNEFSIIFSNQELQTDEIESLYVGTESLAVNIDKFMYQANQSTVTFKELRGLSFVVLGDIGPWRQVIQDEIPDATFMYQARQNAMKQLTTYSNFPYFTTNITNTDLANDETENDRIMIPISDSAAHMPIFANYLKTNKRSLRSLINEIRSILPN